MIITRISYISYNLDFIEENDLENILNKLSIEFQIHKDNESEDEIWIEPIDFILKILVQKKIISNLQLEEINKNDLDYIVLI